MNRRVPKRGFTNIFKKQIAVINLDDLDKMTRDTSSADLEAWANQGLINKAKDGVKVLGRGELSRPLTVRAHYFSETAKQKIVATGGKIEEII